MTQLNLTGDDRVVIDLVDSSDDEDALGKNENEDRKAVGGKQPMSDSADTLSQ